MTSLHASSRLIDLNVLLDQLHASLRETLQDNDRFGVYLIEQDGHRRTLKLAHRDDLVENVERDMRMSMFLSTLGQAAKTNTYRVRDIYGFGPGWFVGEFFDAPVLLKEQHPDQDEAEVVRIAHDVWAPFMAEASSYTPFFLQQRPFYISIQGKYTSAYYERHKELVNWADRAIESKIIDRSDVQKMMDYIEGNARMITFGLELIDVKPWDAFLLGGDRVGLVDLEFSTVKGRQYFDIAWNYIRLYADLHSPAAAHAFMRSFVEHSVEDMRAFAAPFLTALGMKLLGYFYDTVDYLERAQQEDTVVPLYSIDEMQALLTEYLKFNVRELS